MMIRMESTMDVELIVDSFAGGGGAGHGIARALGRSADLAINHDASAITMYAKNHPDTLTMTEDVWKVAPLQATGGRRVALLWASPDCKHFSRAKGGKPVEKRIRSLAWVVVKWADQVRPRTIFLENVREFADWGPIVPAWHCRACQWRGTEGQATLVRTRRRCPKCESLRLSVSTDLIPDPARKGLTFKRWVGRLRGLGYQVEWKNLNAADYGAPTHRRRLFLIARCDGAPIVWAEPTHGDPKKLDAQPLFDRLKPWRTAAECIDWTLDCPSIFDRKRPLAEATMRRIALGIKRYVLENPRPFIVGVGGRMGQSAAAPVDQPSNTVTAKNDRAVVSPVLVRIGQTGGNGKYANDAREPLTSITSKQEHCVVSPYLVPLTHQGERNPNSLEEPMPIVTGANRGEMALIAPVIASLAHGDGGTFGDSRSRSVEQPVGTIHAGGGNYALVAAFLAKHFGGVVGTPVDQPASTVTAKDHQSLVTANLIRFNFDDAGQAVDDPLPTITANNHAALLAANLIRMSHGEKQWNGVDDPLCTITSQGNKFALIYSFLIRYFGTAIGQHVTEPLFTITGKDRFGLVTVTIDGEPYIIADIGMRMLSPRELARAQGFDDSYVLTGTKTSQVAKIGNSVPPVMAEVLVKANLCVEAVAA